MRTLLRKKGYVPFVFMLLWIAACKKTDSPVSNLSGPVENLRHVVQGEHVKIAWDQSSESFTHYVVELSRLADFSVLNQSVTLEHSVNEHIFWKLDRGEDYYCRIKKVDEDTETDWATVDFNTSESNILLPVASEDLEGKTAILRWDPISSDVKLSKIVLKPVLGAAKEYPLTSSDLSAKSLTIEGLDADMQYDVRLYDGGFVVGRTEFITLAVPENGVWTLSPHSNLLMTIETSANGDRIVLRPGIYDLSTLIPSIQNKSIAIEGENADDLAKLYARNFLLNGVESGISFKNLEISGTRIDRYNQELSNSQDHLWNNWLISLDVASSGLDAISFDNCIVRNYWSGIFQMNDTNRPPHKVGNAIRINNCIIHDIGGNNESPTLAINAAQVHKFEVSNSTFYRTNRLFVKVDAERNAANVVDFVFKNNTVNESWAGGSFDFLAVKAPSKFSFENNNLTNMTSSGNFFPNFAYVQNTFNKRLINSNFFNVKSKSTIYGSNSSNMPVHSWELRHPNTMWNEVVPAFTMNDGQHQNPNSIQEYPVSFDPGYTDVANGDFTVSASSPLRTLAQGNAIGDPRWW